MDYKPIRSPLKWVGGKSKICRKIASLMPPHDCYVEVFGGAGWVLFAKPPSSIEVFNDIDGELVNFFRVVKYRPQELIDAFKWDLVSREEFYRLLSCHPDNMGEVERAHRFFYLLMASWGGELHLPRFQVSVDDGGKGNRLIGALRNLEERIMPAYRRLQGVIIENLDWRELVARYDKEGKSRVLMYFDPPYPNNPCNYRYNMRALAEHKELVEVLRNLKAKFILSSYDLPEIREMYKEFNVISLSFPAGMPDASHKKRTRNREILVANYDIKKIAEEAGILGK
ncbi:DNA adenine methylase [Moorellaceae bacterium AZ2]